MVNQASDRVTLNRLAWCAGALHRCRRLFAVIAVAAGIWFVATLFAESGDSAISLLPLTLLLWALFVIGSGSLLSQLPSAAEAGDGLARRIRKRLLIFAYLLAMLVSVVLLGFVAFLSLRLFGLLSG